MTTESPDINTITKRLERLEKQNRTFKRAALALLAILAAVVFMGYSCQKQPEPSRGFVLKDAQGNTRASLEMEADSPVLRFFDANGKPVVILDSAAQSSYLMLTNDNSSVVLKNSDFEGMAIFGNNAAIAQNNRSGGLRVSVGIDHYDPHGIRPNGVPSISLYDDGGIARASLTLGSTRQPVIVSTTGEVPPGNPTLDIPVLYLNDSNGLLTAMLGGSPRPYLALVRSDQPKRNRIIDTEGIGRSW
jgi:hypothetical protein